MSAGPRLNRESQGEYRARLKGEAHRTRQVIDNGSPRIVMLMRQKAERRKAKIRGAVYFCCLLLVLVLLLVFV